jgi:hypothetical protein
MYVATAALTTGDTAANGGCRVGDTLHAFAEETAEAGSTATTPAGGGTATPGQRKKGEMGSTTAVLYPDDTAQTEARSPYRRMLGRDQLLVVQLSQSA